MACGGEPGGNTTGDIARRRLIVGRFDDAAAREGGLDCVLGRTEPGMPLTARCDEDDPGLRFGGAGGGGACVGA